MTIENSWDNRPIEDTLARRFVWTAKSLWSTFAIADTLGQKLSYGKLLVSVVVLSKIFKKMTVYQENVGLLLPTSVAGAVTNIALTLIGRTVVNINYTAGEKNIQAAIKLCEIHTIITSRRFLERLKLEKTDRMVFLEDIASKINFFCKMWTFLRCRFMKPENLWRRHGNTIHTKESLATIIFSSGSTGVPKGIMLSHHNILSNVEQLKSSFPLSADECFVGILPFFHSFGYTGTLWLPLLVGCSVAYHSNPTEARQTGELIEKFKCTLLITTPTFCSTYIKACSKEMFGSLRNVITGAEKLKETIAISFRHKFGIEILEGYGCTELSPVVSVNIPDANKPGTIGKALPGIETRTVDPEDSSIDLEGDKGMLLVRGPNVMRGYYKRVDLTQAAFHEGWYVTGDIASINNKGYITIHDRLARFSKVGGEMVPHLQIEEELNIILEGPYSFVCGVPDRKKGELLVALYIHPLLTAEEIWKKLKQAALPNLWLPKQNHIYRIEEIPTLGTGKVDLKTAKEIAYLYTAGENL